MFLPRAAGYEGFRREFLRLTGATPLPPLYAFGLWFSRYWPYSEEESLALMDEFRAKGFPLDVLVCDTDWRVGASEGYAVNPKLFPDMKRYLARAHEKGVRVLFNDHPEAQTPGALDPEELRFRKAGIDSLLDLGADGWWYDKNWGKHLNPPEGLNKEFWGMVVYRDMTLRNRPGRRPLIMSNVDGIWGGMRLTPSHPAAHRYPIWWTGDTLATWQDLRSGIANGVTGGIERMMPYINEDMGGHMLAPSPEQFVRWFQFGVFSPLPRLHSYPKVAHYPWAYGEEAEAICRDYALLRYRLLPEIYSAARRNFDTGEPLLARCDLRWPGQPEAASDLQYLFGGDLLVAPQCFSGLDPIPAGLLRTPDGKPGALAEYFENTTLEGPPRVTRVESRIFYDWKLRPKPLAIDKVSARWTAVLGPVPESGEYEFGLISRDGARLWLDGAEIITRTKVLANRQGLGTSTARARLEAGKSYPVKVEFFQETGGECELFMGPAAAVDDRAHQERTVWLPPGRWRDLWTGETLQGPTTLDARSDLAHTPLYAREGGILFTAPHRMSSGVPRWDEITVDAFVPASGTAARELYEDDGLSEAYLDDKSSRTRAELTAADGRVTLRIDPARGTFLEPGFRRGWTLRLHLPAGSRPSDFRVGGQPVIPGQAGQPASANVIGPGSARAFPLGGPGSAPGPRSGPVVEFRVPSHPCAEPLEISLDPKAPPGGERPDREAGR